MPVNNFNLLKTIRPEYPKVDRRSPEKEALVKYIAEQTGDLRSLGAYRAIVDKISEQQIYVFLAIVKDADFSGKIKKSKGALFTSLAKGYAFKNNILLNFK